MATETAETTTGTGLGSIDSTQWLAGAAGGFLGSVLFGLVMQYVMPPPLLETVIPAMYGIEGPALAAGWAIHQFHGVALGWRTSRSSSSTRSRSPPVGSVVASHSAWHTAC
ncbi:hypothetical protein [Halalkalicoccus salilacus]|uniref:hypothetical protein n=1 Tax=Halalkalicoccus sp. GCM10025704 TaxID=3252662 RepID=UPI0036073FCC